MDGDVKRDTRQVSLYGGGSVLVDRAMVVAIGPVLEPALAHPRGTKVRTVCLLGGHKFDVLDGPDVMYLLLERER